jgi:small-conductance mechanosensitive channel
VTRADFDAFFADKALGDQAFAYFDKDFDGVLTAAEVRSSVMAIFDERRNMAASLEDTDSIVRSLQFGVGCALHLVMGAAYLLVWGVDVLKGFSTFSALVLAFTFVFGNSVRCVRDANGLLLCALLCPPPSATTP